MKIWNNFWFGNDDAYYPALFRLVFSLIILTMYSLRHLQVSFYYFQDGFLPLQNLAYILPEFYKPTFFWFPQSDIAVVVMHSCFLVGIFVMALGVFGRWFQVLILALHLMFIYRNPMVIYGADIVSSFWLFYLCLMDTRQHFSILKYFRKAPIKIGPMGHMLNSCGQRLVQIQLCIIYGYTGMEKLKGGPWWDGTALWPAMANSQLALMDFSFILNFPLFIIFGTYFTLIFEIYFPALIWPQKLRPWVLFAGVMFHMMIGVTMGLVFFSLVMSSAYLLFIPPKKHRVA